MNKRFNHLTNTGWLRHKTPKVCPPYNAFKGVFSSNENPRSENEKKTQPSALASGNSPSGGRIKTGINVFVAYIPGVL